MKVKSITIVEKDQEIIDLVFPHLPLQKDCTIVCEDIFNYVPTRKFNAMYFDIWNDINYDVQEIEILGEKLAEYLDISDSDCFMGFWREEDAINQYNDIIIAWHTIHDRNNTIAEEGFVSSSDDLIDHYWKENVISNSEYRDLFYRLNEFSEIPEKLRQAIMEFIDDPSHLSVKSYQNIYHNLNKKNFEDFEQIARKYKQKAQVVKFLNAYGFTKPKPID